MNKSSVVLDRNKIEKIGWCPSVEIAQLNESNQKINSWQVEKVKRRKNKLLCYCDSGEKLTLTFTCMKYAKKTKQVINKALKNWENNNV